MARQHGLDWTSVILHAHIFFVALYILRERFAEYKCVIGLTKNSLSKLVAHNVPNQMTFNPYMRSVLCTGLFYFAALSLQGYLLLRIVS